MFCFLSREQSFLLNFAAARRNRPERCLIDSSSNAASLKSTDRRFLPRRPFFFVASAIPAWRDLRRVQISSPRSPSMPTEKRHLVFPCFLFRFLHCARSESLVRVSLISRPESLHRRETICMDGSPYAADLSALPCFSVLWSSGVFGDWWKGRAYLCKVGDWFLFVLALASHANR